jgi:hypothetical protein
LIILHPSISIWRLQVCMPSYGNWSSQHLMRCYHHGMRLTWYRAQDVSFPMCNVLKIYFSLFLFLNHSFVISCDLRVVLIDTSIVVLGFCLIYMSFGTLSIITKWFISWINETFFHPKLWKSWERDWAIIFAHLQQFENLCVGKEDLW